MSRPAFAYTRVSTAKQQRSSPEVQAVQIAEFCARHDLELQPTIYNEAKSGKFYREQLQAAFDATIAAKGVLVAYDMTRMFRDEIGGLVLMRDLHKAKAIFMTADGSVDTTNQSAAAKFMRTIFLGAAAFQSNQSGEKVALENSKTVHRLGYRTQGGQPYGYKNQKDRDAADRVINCHRVEIPAEQAVIARIRLLHRQKHSNYEIARQLTTEGVPTRKGVQAWSPETIRKILRRA